MLRLSKKRKVELVTKKLLGELVIMVFDFLDNKNVSCKFFNVLYSISGTNGNMFIFLDCKEAAGRNFEGDFVRFDMGGDVYIVVDQTVTSVKEIKLRIRRANDIATDSP